MIQITIITLICCLLFGVPIAFAIGIAGTAGLYFGSTAPMFMVVKQFFEGINSFSYMAIPLFILAGAIMGKGGISKRIVNFASAILSWLRGGTAITTVGASMIFAAVSGSGAATISAIGGITVPEMLKKGYSRGFTAAMSAGAGSLGPIVPPSVDMIVFGCITGFSISRLFVGGIIPGFIIGLSLMIYCYIYAKKRNIDYGGKFRGKVVWAAFKDSIWALLMPIIIIGGVMGGAFTATEAGAVACVYGLIVSVFVYKSMSFKDLINVLRSASVNMAMVMMIIGFSSIFSYIFALEGMGQKIVDFMLSITTSPTGLFFLVIAFNRLLHGIACSAAHHPAYHLSHVRLFGRKPQSARCCFCTEYRSRRSYASCRHIPVPFHEPYRCQDERNRFAAHADRHRHYASCYRAVHPAADPAVPARSGIRRSNLILISLLHIGGS